MTTTDSSNTVCVFDLKGQRLCTQSTTLELILDTETIFNRTQPGTVTSYLKDMLAGLQTLPQAIGVKFEKFTDGRSYSIASRLREIGYEGELHALGEINQELIFLLRRVGFTHFHIPDPGTPTLAPEILKPFNGYYQAGSDGTRAQWQG
jgi:uncharacterized protein (DUF934 family)